jgi:hypothetical protein
MSSLFKDIPPLNFTGDGNNLKLKLMMELEEEVREKFSCTKKPVSCIMLEQEADEVTFCACLYKNPHSQDSFLVHFVWI